MSRLHPTLRYWKEVAGAKVVPPVWVAWKVVTGTGTSWPILSEVFLPSAARRRGAARMRVLLSVWRNLARMEEGTLTTKSARLKDESRWARTWVRPSVDSFRCPVGEKVTPAL